MFRVLQNTGRILFVESLDRWRRELRTFVPALASITLLLLLAGVVGLLSLAGMTVLGSQTQAADVLHVYLNDGVGPDDVAALIADLHSDSRVRSVKFVSKEEALAQARSHPGLDQIINATDGNPFPASLQIAVTSVDDMAAIDGRVRMDSHVDQQLATSYDADTYKRLGQLILGIEVVGGALLILLGVVAFAITGTTIRGVVIARRDELKVMWMVGTPGWMVKGPFIVQGAATGMVAGTLAGLFVLGLCAATIGAASEAFMQALPGVTVEASLLAAVIIAGTGAGLGAFSAMVELRRS